MPSLSSYKEIYGRRKTDGQVRKSQADAIMEARWYEDIATRTCFLYDWYHDTHHTTLNELTPFKDKYKIPISVKYLVNSSQTFEKDNITYHIQMKPSQECNVKYYDEFFKNRYDAMFPCGLYIDIPDSKGVFNRWLVVAGANVNDPQFQTFEVLRCNKIIQYIYDGVKYNIPSVLRSQNSYNSGVWSDRNSTIVEDQQKFIAPLNRETEKIYYNQRMIIDNKILTEPRAWRITKVNRIGNNGLGLYTLAQDMFNNEKDYIEIGDNGEVIGMWADYYSSSVEPEPYKIPDPRHEEIHSVISYNGTLPQLKINGSYKKLTVNFYDKEMQPIEFRQGTWSFTIDGNDASDLITVLTNTESADVLENQIKVKFDGDIRWLKKTMLITYTSDDGIVSDLEMEIASL